MSKVALQDTKRWDCRVTGRRIPSDYREEICNVVDLIERANILWNQSQEEAETLKKKAYEDGWEAGRKDVLAQMAQLMTETQTSMREQLESSEQRVINAASVLFKRIIPNLSNELVLDDLINTALKSMHAERFIRVFVHASVIESVRAKAGQWRILFPSINSFEIIADETLGAYGCVVESEVGSVHAGLDEQLESLITFASRSVEKVDNRA